MKTISKICALLYILFQTTFTFAQTHDEYEFRGPYLGHKPPGDIPLIFASDAGPSDKPKLNPSFSPDENTFLYTVELIPGRSYEPYIMHQKNGVWSEPKIVSLYEKYQIGEPFVSPDGDKLFFRSMIAEDGSQQNNADIWWAEITSNGFINPQKIGLSVNSEFNEAYPTVSSDGTLYFHSNRGGGVGSVDLYCSQFVNDQFVEPVNLGENVNSPSPEFHPFISPDENYLIFSSLNRPDGLGGIDLYVTFRDKNGVWKEAINLGKAINSTANDYMPFISRDGKYLFFTSTRIQPNQSVKQTSQQQFGKSEIYWVDAKIIESLRPKQ